MDTATMVPSNLGMAGNPAATLLVAMSECCPGQCILDIHAQPTNRESYHLVRPPLSSFTDDTVHMEVIPQVSWCLNILTIILQVKLIL
jgi:hypothetical protein